MNTSRAGEMARYGLAEARRSVQALRPQLLEENELCAALDGLIRKMTSGTNLQGGLLLQGNPRALPDNWNEHLLRIAQEVLTNTLRHANAAHFSARLVFDSNALQLELRDDGECFDLQQKRGFGLLGIRERAGEIGGELQIHSAPGEGTIIGCAAFCANIQNQCNQLLKPILRSQSEYSWPTITPSSSKD